MWLNISFNLWLVLDLCCRQPVVNILFMVLCGRIWHARVLVHVRTQTNSHFSKQTQTNVSYLETDLESQRGREFASCFTVSSGCSSWNRSVFEKGFIFIVWPPLLLLLAVRSPVWLPSRSAFTNLSSLEDIPLREDNNQGRATPSLPLCSLKRLPQLASFLMMRVECLLLSVLLSKQFPQCGLPPPDPLTLSLARRHSFIGKKGPGCTFI